MVQESRGPTKATFANPDDLPAFLLQLARDLLVTFYIALDLSSPKGHRGRRNALAARAAMPETTVDKHCDPCFLKYEIRITKNTRFPAPSDNARGPK